MLGLCCCSPSFSSLREQELLPSCNARASHWVASFVVENRLRCAAFSSRGSQAQLPCNMQNLLRPMIEPMSSALAGKFLTTAPPGKSYLYKSDHTIQLISGVKHPLHFADFTQHDVLKVHPCGSMCQNFLPFYLILLQLYTTFFLLLCHK